MALKYEIKAPNGTYEKDGVEKTRYTKIGAVFEKNGNLSLKIETLPMGWDGFAFLNVPEDRNGQQRGGGSNGSSGNIPF